jgi:chromosome segregation protein
VYLKSLTLRGFKSFASSTTLNFEPGIVCVVGPNGSGKSNVVDALAWVMGEQGAKSLRGGKMEDVIFAGTSGRAPLGRAEVLLTIDNSDGALPIDYTEVTLSRTMFRNGGSEYAINGTPCRLLDVQELLSDSGIGREMHVIVGQGQLDAVLRATPEERRGFIEEAAGVLKHRKRKEKALRKLESTDGNLTRLQDVLTELRRQLKPLGRQAEVARKAAVIQADARDARARLLADDIVTARGTIAAELADETALKERRAEVEGAIAEAQTTETELEEALRGDSPRLAAAQEAWYSLSGLRERMRGTAGLATERVRQAAVEADDRRVGRDPVELEAEAERVESAQAELTATVQASLVAREAAAAARMAAEAELAEEERRVAGLRRAAADRREGLARLHGQVNAIRSRAEAADDEIGRLTVARDEADQRAATAQQEFVTQEQEIAGLNAGESGLDAELDTAESHLAAVEDKVSQLARDVHDAERRQSGLAARTEALEVGAESRDGAGALLAASDEISGFLGSVAALLTVRSGHESAIAAALGAAADAVAVDHLDSAVVAMEKLKAEDWGRAGILLGGNSGAGIDDSQWPGLPTYATYAVDVVDAPPTLGSALRRVLFKVAVVDDLSAAKRLVSALPDVTAVTLAGDILGPHFAVGGSPSTGSLIEVRAAIEQAEIDLATATHEVEALRFEQQRAEAERVEAQRAVDAALARLHESDAEMAAVAERLGHLGSAVRGARGESDRLSEAIVKAQEARERDVEGLTELLNRLEQAEAAPDEEPSTVDLEALAEKAIEARRAETDALLALRTNEERERALRDQVEALRASAAEEREARVRDQERRERQRREAQAAQAVLTVVNVVLSRIAESIDGAAIRRSQIETARGTREESLRAIRTTLRDLGKDLDALTDSVHKDELQRAEMRLRMEALEARALEELGLEVEALIAEYGPAQLVPFVGESDEPVEPTPFDRAEQTERLRKAERGLAMLGKVNPLALEEFSALEERHQFLSEQFDDLRRTRKDLLDIVDEVDAKVLEVLAEAWRDVEEVFQDVFTRLFPGGEGRLVLTDPNDLLNTGVEVEARPPGKKVKRLSLLSGGERSLVAVAFLVSLFKARPSPFYILDEVEAALDDTNLGRLLQIYEELRDNSQLIVITHQKRTMEVADALYGVSMRGDGVTSVISQRLREEVSA